MRITQEADNAVRIVGCLAGSGSRMEARAISEQTGVTLRFTLKTLRKLVQHGLVQSYVGAAGGYELAAKPGDINMRQVIEAVDGPIAISRCVSGETPCGQNEAACACGYRAVFADVSKTIQEKLESIRFDTKP